MQTSETSEKIVLRKSPAYHINNLLNTQSARLSGDVCGARLCASNAYLISDQERKWRDAILKYDFNEMSRLLSNDPELVNWRDYITGCWTLIYSFSYLPLPYNRLTPAFQNTALHFAAQVNDMSLVRLLAGTYKANVDIRNHGLTPLHMAAIGASEEVAFTLMSQFNAKATVRDYSGRLPFNYLPDTEAGNRLKSQFRSQYAKMLEGLPLLKKVLLETPPAPAALSARPTPPSAPRPPPATATTSQGPPMSSDRSEPKPAKRTNLLFCSLRGTSKSHQSRNSVQMRAPGWTEEQMVTRDDVSPTSPTQISGFLSLKKHKTKARPTLPQTEASDFTSEMYLTIRRRKSERGRNYNPMDPAHQQTSFRGTAPIKHTRTIRLDENPDRTSLTPDIRPRVPRSHPLPQEGPFDPL